MKKHKDYYSILGVDKNASEEEIKTAYRTLAKQFHPDINKDKDAEEKFKDISNAYEMLTDPKKKQQYDSPNFSDSIFFDSTFSDSFGYTRSTRRNMDLDQKAGYRVSLKQVLKEEKIAVSLQRFIMCDKCHGDRVILGNGICSNCNGTGATNILMGGLLNFRTACPVCHGLRKETTKCASCNGEGGKYIMEKVEFKLPQNILPLHSIRLKGKGNEVYFSNEKMVGDFYIVIDYPTQQDNVTFNNGDFYASIMVPFNLILEEKTINVNILDFKNISLKLRSNVKSGYQYDFDGGGIDSNHKAHIKVFVDIPKNNSDEKKHKRLIKLLGEIYDNDPGTFSPSPIN